MDVGLPPLFLISSLTISMMSCREKNGFLQSRGCWLTHDRDNARHRANAYFRLFLAIDFTPGLNISRRNSRKRSSFLYGSLAFAGTPGCHRTGVAIAAGTPPRPLMLNILPSLGKQKGGSLVVLACSPWGNAHHQNGLFRAPSHSRRAIFRPGHQNSLRRDSRMQLSVRRSR